MHSKNKVIKIIFNLKNRSQNLIKYLNLDKGQLTEPKAKP